MKEMNVIDVGDGSVGLPDLLVASVKVSDEMYELMNEQKTLREFHIKLEALIDEFYAPENKYVVVDDELERKYWEAENEAHSV